MFIEELANEDVAAVINDTNRGRIRKLEARIEDLEALLAEKDETIAKKDKQINELHFLFPHYFSHSCMPAWVMQRVIFRISASSLKTFQTSGMIYENIISILIFCK